MRLLTAEIGDEAGDASQQYRYGSDSGAGTGVVDLGGRFRYADLYGDLGTTADAAFFIFIGEVLMRRFLGGRAAAGADMPVTVRIAYPSLAEGVALLLCRNITTDGAVLIGLFCGSGNIPAMLLKATLASTVGADLVVVSGLIGILSQLLRRKFGVVMGTEARFGLAGVADTVGFIGGVLRRRTSRLCGSGSRLPRP